MRYNFFIIFFLFFIPCYAQPKTTPEFFLNDPAINKKGKLSLPSKYLKDFSFNQGLAEVIIKDSSNGLEMVRMGLVNKKGRFVVEPDYYNDYKIISPNRILICKNHRWGMLSVGENTYVSLEPIYKSIEVISENSFKVKHFNTWELKDSTLKSINQFYYDSILFYSDSILKYTLNAKSGYINFSNVEPKKIRRELVCPIQSITSILFSKINFNNKYGIMNWEGDTIIPVKYDSIVGPLEGLFMVYKDDSISIIDKSGEVMMELNKRFEKIFPFYEGRAMFIKAGKYGFIDQRGNVRVAPQYTYIRDFHEGASAAVINGRWGFIDKDENIIVQPHYSDVLDFKNGTARVKLKDKWHFVSKKGEMLNQAYDEIKETNSNKWLLVRNNKKGLADVNGRELLAPRYDYIQDLENGKVIVSKNGLYGILDYKENFIYPISVDYISYKYGFFLFMKKGKEELREINDGKRR